MQERYKYFEIICRSLKADLNVTIVPLEGSEFGGYGVQCEVSSGVGEKFILNREILRGLLMDVFADKLDKVSAVFRSLDNQNAVNLVSEKGGGRRP